MNNKSTKNKKLRALEILCSTLQSEIDETYRQIKKLRSNMLTIEDAKKRDYIVRNKYIGKLKDNNLIKDFKEEIHTVCENSFDCVCNDLLNYRLANLQIYSETLNKYELKQIVLDTYAIKK
jgi:hypothetical protein